MTGYAGLLSHPFGQLLAERTGNSKQIGFDEPVFHDLQFNLGDRCPAEGFFVELDGSLTVVCGNFQWELVQAERLRMALMVDVLEAIPSS